MKPVLTSDTPNYFIGEAARYLRLPPGTVHSWAMGRSSGPSRLPPLIAPADPKTPLLSFSNLLELHLLASMRKKHRLSAQTVRKGLKYLQEKLGVDRPLLHQAMLTDGKDLLIDRLGQLVNISRHGQTHLKEAILSGLDRIERDDRGVGIQLFPFTRTSGPAPKFVAMNPTICAGRPCIVGTRLPTDVIASRHRAGDSFLLLADDYGVNVERIEEAIRYESRAAA